MSVPTRMASDEDLRQMEDAAATHGGWYAAAFKNLAWNYRLTVEQMQNGAEEIQYLRDLCRENGIKYKLPGRRRVDTSRRAPQ